MRSAILAAILISLAAFQNCGSQGSFQPQGSQGKTSEVPVAPQASYTKLVYDQSLEIFRPNATFDPRLEIDLLAGNLKIAAAGIAVKQCAIDQSRLSELRDVLAQAKICRPAPLDPGMATCLAIGLADIELTDSSGQTQQLRPVICNSGLFLCDSLDQKLRAAIDSLIANPPVSCN